MKHLGKKLKPIFKNGRNMILSFSDQFFLLQKTSMTIERVVHNPVIDFLSDQNITYDYQSEF